MKLFYRLLLALAVLAACIPLFVYSGVYNVAADAPHTAPLRWLLHQTYEHSVARRAADIVPPADLDAPSRLPVGAAHYQEMCVGCHLAPGLSNTELRQGLNPAPPDLVAAATTQDPRQLFWVIKHGVKMTAMPAWGRTHDDDKLWDIVALLQRLPALSAAEYHRLVDRGAARDDDDDDPHAHAGAD